MSSQVRYRGGDCKPVAFKTNSLYPFEEGDLLYLSPADNTVRPASAFPKSGTVATDQDAFQQFFAGVAMQKSGLQTGETSFRLTTDLGYAMVATGGDFEFDCPSTSWVTGGLVGAYGTTAGLEDQKVTTAASESLAIGKAKPGVTGLGAAVTRIVVEIRSTIMRDSIQAQVAGVGSGQ